MKYTLCSGFYKDPFFACIWKNNVSKYANPSPENLVVIEVGGRHAANHLTNQECAGSFITLSGNLGHIGALLDGSKDRDFCGWSAAVCALAMIAYTNETDLLYIESDCLAFGPWVEQIYKDMGDGDFVFGHKQESEPFMECSQSLFLVRHRFIPTFVSEYLALGDERHKDELGLHDNLPERKFVKIEQKFGDKRVKRLSFGCDRTRPLPVDAPVFYAQKFSTEELAMLKEKGLL
jgi:hypothetical protein